MKIKKKYLPYFFIVPILTLLLVPILFYIFNEEVLEVGISIRKFMTKGKVSADVMNSIFSSKIKNNIFYASTSQGYKNGAVVYYFCTASEKELLIFVKRYNFRKIEDLNFCKTLWKEMNEKYKNAPFNFPDFSDKNLFFCDPQTKTQGRGVFNIYAFQKDSSNEFDVYFLYIRI